jgi:hypothetical protein
MWPNYSQNFMIEVLIDQGNAIAKLGRECFTTPFVTQERGFGWLRESLHAGLSHHDRVFG